MRSIIISLFILNCSKSMKELTCRSKIGNEYWKYIKEDKSKELGEFLNEPFK